MSNSKSGSGTLLFTVAETLSIPATVLPTLPIRSSRNSSVNGNGPNESPRNVLLNGLELAECCRK